jgi:hypothetical protein
MSTTDQAIPSQNENNEQHGSSHPITKLKQWTTRTEPSHHKTKTMSTTIQPSHRKNNTMSTTDPAIHHKIKTMRTRDQAILSQNKNNEHHGSSYPITKLKQWATRIKPSHHKSKAMSNTDPAITSQNGGMAGCVLLILLVLWWDGWLRVAHCFSFVMEWLDPWCSLF